MHYKRVKSVRRLQYDNCENVVSESAIQPPAVCQLQVKLLLQFVENLDKLMYSAYEGAAVSLPPFPKVTKPSYFITKNVANLTC
jgi:hypothetical protein